MPDDYGVMFMGDNGRLSIDSSYSNFALIGERKISIGAHADSLYDVQIEWRYAADPNIISHSLVAKAGGDDIRGCGITGNIYIIRNGVIKLATSNQSSIFVNPSANHIDIIDAPGYSHMDPSGFKSLPHIHPVSVIWWTPRIYFKNLATNTIHPIVALRHGALRVGLVSYGPNGDSIRVYIRNTSPDHDRDFYIRIFTQPTYEDWPGWGLRVRDPSGNTVFDSSVYYLSVKSIDGISSSATADVSYSDYYIPGIPAVCKDTIGQTRNKNTDMFGITTSYEYRNFLHRRIYLVAHAYNTVFIRSRLVVNREEIFYKKVSLISSLISEALDGLVNLYMDTTGFDGLVKAYRKMSRMFASDSDFPPGEIVNEGEYPIIRINDISPPR